tara:strand:+ start:599 stop:856 length:258 start_codon:yes stop_codon:yes gene_type:complete
MKIKHKYYLGMTLCFIFGALLTPVYGILILLLRLTYCLCGAAVETLLFVPIVATEFHNKFWEKVEQLKEKNNHLNQSGGNKKKFK